MKEDNILLVAESANIIGFFYCKKMSNHDSYYVCPEQRGKAGKWVMNSCQVVEFISQTRWLSAVEAMEFYNKWVAAVCKWVEKETTWPLNIPDDLELT